MPLNLKQCESPYRYSICQLKYDVLFQTVVGLRVKENKEVYEGEVTELTPEYTQAEVPEFPSKDHTLFLSEPLPFKPMCLVLLSCQISGRKGGLQ